MSHEEFSKAGCQHCGNHIEFPSELHGTVVACPHCNQQTTLLPADAAGSLEAAVSLEGLGDILIPPAPTPPSYRLGLLLAAVMLVLLPVVYLAVVVAVGWATWLFAVHGWSMLGEGLPRRGGILYLAPLSAGLAVLLFVLAPLARRRPRPPQALAVNPEAEPVLFDFVCRVCRVVGRAFVLHQETQLPLNLRARLQGKLDDGPGEWFASHPSDVERVQRARQRQAPGLLKLDGPASGLFCNFTVACRHVTLLHYTEDLGIPILPAMLFRVQDAASSKWEKRGN